MKKRRIVMYLGGFAKVGGIEAFARDFLLAIAATYPERELVMWGNRGKDHRLLNDIVNSGATISRSPWRWGCRWNVPDYVLAPIGLTAVRRAAAVIFQRPPPPRILRLLRRAGGQNGRRIPFILVMPYRPAEYWGASPASSQFENFDVIAVQSEEGVHDLEKAGYRGRIENIPYLPPESEPPADYPARRGDGTIRLGFLGRMAAQKNLGYLLEIYQVLTQKLRGDNRYELHLFGDGGQHQELKQRCADLALQNVVFHGETPRSEVARAIDSCDIFLNTSLTEGQCLAALEVLSRGRPLIATPVGALPEVLRDDELGRLAPLDDASAFAAAVVEVAHAIRVGRMTPQSVAAAFKARYDYESILKRYLDLLAGTDLIASEG
ncbi:MAG TPA: glycosyltransferase [Candidatus Methylacidiphilales bacterium]|jgi:glycosyltransferase involved in cell wall biosynthesis|nr:glycosyltransferase [Candidatus Methylacidiphilales bacterium]